MTTKLIMLEDIAFTKSPKVRARNPDPEIVAQYSQAYSDRKEMPPIVVFYDASLKLHYLADGLHRCVALQAINRRTVMAIIHEGPFSEALKYALLANSNHGLQRSNADKRQCVFQALIQWPDISNVGIAKMADVDDKTVAVVRSEMEDMKKIKPSATRKASDGRNMRSTAPRKSEVVKEEDEEKPHIVTHEPVKDSLGVVIPTAVAQYWERQPEIDDLMEDIDSVISTLKEAGKNKDIMFGEVNITGTIADLEKAKLSVQTAKPYAVCTSCQGHPETQKQGCRLCLGRGLISKFRYEALVPQEIKDIAKKKGAK